MGAIAYAEKKGYTPVVDMKHYPNIYLYDDEVGKVNSWEYYFEQPGGLSLEKALSCRKYIISKDSMHHYFRAQGYIDFYNRDGELDYWRGICRKYIRFSKPVLDVIEHESQKFAGKRVLGVSVRGTDYTSRKPAHHPVQPTIEQAVAKAREVFGTGTYDAVYLATEDKNIIVAFREAFGEKLILPDRDAIDYDPSADKWITECFSDRRENDKYLTGLEYLVSMLMLTKCTGLITSQTAGSTAIMYLSDGWEYLYVFELGFYK